MMFKNINFRFRYRRLKKMPNPLKMFADESATNFSFFFSKDKQKNMKVLGNQIDHGFDLKNTIDDYGLVQAPEQPPFSAEAFESMKRIKRNNFLLMLAFILCEGAFNYFALKAMLPGHNVFIEIIRIATAVVISVMALFLVENFIITHFHYLTLKQKDELTNDEKGQMIRLRSKRNLYLSASLVLAVVLVSLGIVREFIIAGGVTANLWIMLVTVGIAVIVAVALGLQGAEVTEIIHKYRRMIKWQRLKNQIDYTERKIGERIDLIDRKIEEEINNHWAWMHYLKRWLLREFDEDDKEKTVEEKQQLIYTNYSLFKNKLLSQSEDTLAMLKSYRDEYEQLLHFDYQKLIEEKS